MFALVEFSSRDGSAESGLRVSAPVIGLFYTAPVDGDATRTVYGNAFRTQFNVADRIGPGTEVQARGVGTSSSDNFAASLRPRNTTTRASPAAFRDERATAENRQASVAFPGPRWEVIADLWCNAAAARIAMQNMKQPCPTSSHPSAHAPLTQGARWRDAGVRAAAGKEESTLGGTISVELCPYFATSPS